MNSNIEHKAVAALLRGLGCANSLKTLLENLEISSVSTEPLISTILESFSLALSSMGSPNPLPHHASSSQNTAGPVHQRSSKKRICGVEGIENYRDDSPTPHLDDGFTWRKYGQKTIKTSLHQRCYYRCTYAKKQNCNALKRVQKIKDNPSVYRTTYVGQHVCKAPTFSVNDNTYGVMPEPVLPQLASFDHQKFAMEDKATDHIMNQDCDINDILMDDDQFLVNEFPPLSPGDFMFLDNIAPFD